MLARPFHFTRDYPVVYDWWKGWKWEPISPEFLPPTGIMIENNGELVCCCWIYRTDTAFCIIDYFLMNPKAKKKNRKGCVDFLTKEALKKAKDMGFKVADTMTANKHLIRTLENNGYRELSVVTKMMRIL